MNDFKMKCKTTTAGLPFEYDFEMASVQMAREYVKRHVGKWSQVPWFMAMELWVNDDKGLSVGEDNWKPIAEYTLLRREYDTTERIIGPDELLVK